MATSSKPPASGARPRPRDGGRRRDEILRYITKYYSDFGQSPSLEQIGLQVGISRTAVRYHVDRLEDEGQLKRGPGYRALRPAKIDPGQLNFLKQAQ